MLVALMGELLCDHGERLVLETPVWEKFQENLHSRKLFLEAEVFVIYSFLA
jgi:hypothetical protein